jgi:DNA-binding transcriptional regulator GbsR (MarR family)
MDGALDASERSFVDNWGGLAEAFGMKRDLGRAHALIYIALEPLDDAGVARRLGLTLEDAKRYVTELCDWGVVRASPTPGQSVYSTDHDPWVWFLRIVAERHHRDFTPVLLGMRRTLEAVKTLDASHPPAKELRHRAERFTTFVEDLSRLIELFIRLGAKPMALVLKTVAKLTPRF